MRLTRPLYVRFAWMFLVATTFVPGVLAQKSPSATAVPDPSLADSVKQLQQQVSELRAIVSDLRSQSERYRSETEALRQELRTVVAQFPPPAGTQEAASSSAQAPSSAPSPAAAEAASTTHRESDTAGRVAKLEEQFDLLTGKVDDQYQTKVESGSKYRVRLSGLVLMNLFTNRGAVDSADLPGLVDGPDVLGRANSTGISLRQSQLGLEVFGPEVAGARTRGDVQVDFAGGSPLTANGVAFGLMRLRTGTIHLDWQHTSVIAGQDAPFFSALSPTSFATVAEPAFAYAGNLWTWIPQVRVEHRMTLSEDSSVTLQAGILDGLTGEAPPPSYARTAQAGEFSRQPGYAGRAAWSHNLFGQAVTLGAGGYYSRQNWGFGRNIDGWAGTLDWTAPLGPRLSLSGEFYRGRALGGLGGGLYHSAVFTGYPTDPATRARGLDAIGGWSQLKLRASSKVEFNLAAGQDNPFANEIRAFPYSAYGVGPLSSPLMRNQSELFNVIYHPRSDLVFSAEYGHISTYETDNTRYTADHVNLVMGILF
jgi:hypothetical protein